MVDKRAVAKILEEIGTLLELQGDNLFMGRAGRTLPEQEPTRFGVGIALKGGLEKGDVLNHSIRRWGGAIVSPPEQGVKGNKRS